MRMTAFALLVAANILAALGLAYLWVEPTGTLKQFTWTPPPPLKPELPKMPFVAAKIPGEPSAFIATLERPLFAIDRRPPPPPPPVVAAAPTDSLTSARLLGVINGPSGMALVSAEGKVRQVRLKGQLGDWTLSSISGREATFERPNEQRVLRLEYASLSVQQSGGDGKAFVASVAGATAADVAANLKRQDAEQAERERNVAAMRAKMDQLNQKSQKKP